VLTQAISDKTLMASMTFGEFGESIQQLKCFCCWPWPADGSSDSETLSVSSEVSNSSSVKSSLVSASTPRQYELPRRRPVSKPVLNKAGRPKQRAFALSVVSFCFLKMILFRFLNVFYRGNSLYCVLCNCSCILIIFYFFLWRMEI